MVNQNHVRQTVSRMQKAIQEDDLVTLGAIIESLQPDQAKALIAAMALALFDV